MLDRPDGATSVTSAALAVLVALCVMVGAAPVATPVPGAVLIGGALELRQVTVESVVDGVVRYLDRQGRLQTQTLDRLLQIRFDGGAQVDGRAGAENGAVLVELHDGQRIVGRWEGGDASGRSVTVLHAAFGAVSVALDKVTAIVFDQSIGRSTGEADGDVLELANADVLEGSVEGIVGQTVRLRVEGVAEVLTVPIERVRRLRLANPAAQAERRGHCVWLADGSRVRVAAISLDEGQVVLRGAFDRADQTVQVALDQVARIDVDSAVGRLVGLTDLGMTVTGPADVFGLVFEPVVVDGPAIRLHAPTRVEFALPSGSTRFAARAELDEPARGTDGALSGNFVVIVWIDGRQAGRFRIDADHPWVRINVPARGSVLGIELEEGANGPIGDRLVLRDSVVLVRSD